MAEKVYRLTHRYPSHGEQGVVLDKVDFLSCFGTPVTASSLAGDLLGDKAWTQSALDTLVEVGYLEEVPDADEGSIAV